jgi:hypothetical protein
LTVTNTEVVSVRVLRDLKAASAAVMEQDQHNLASMVEFMVLDCGKGGAVPLPTTDTKFTDGRLPSLKNNKSKRF